MMITTSSQREAQCYLLMWDVTVLKITLRVVVRQRFPTIFIASVKVLLELDVIILCKLNSNNIMELVIDYYNIAGSQCIENSIQLIGELSQQVGTPVICLGGGWGKVCDRLDTAAAIVVCRQLGFSIESKSLVYLFPLPNIILIF